MGAGTVSAVPRVGCVVVHYGDPEVTARCLRSLLTDPSGAGHEIVVVDNAGNLAGEEPAGASLVASPGNPGFGGGANRGVEALGAGPWDALVVLNNDAEVLPGFLDAAAAAVARPGIAAAAGPLYLGDERLWYAGGGVRFLTGTVRQSCDPADAALERTVGFLPGTAVAFAPRAWRELGGFDPRYFLYHEDLDLCLRARRRGWSLLFAPGMAARHHLGTTTGSAELSPLYLENLARTRLRPFRPLAYRLYLAAVHSAYVAVRALRLALRPGPPGVSGAAALLRGHAAALAGLLEGPRA